MHVAKVGFLLPKTLLDLREQSSATDGVGDPVTGG